MADQRLRQERGVDQHEKDVEQLGKLPTESWLDVVLEVDTIDWCKSDEAGTRQYTLEATGVGKHAGTPIYLLMIWDDKGRGAPRPAQRFRVVFEPLED